MVAVSCHLRHRVNEGDVRFPCVAKIDRCLPNRPVLLPLADADRERLLASSACMQQLCDAEDRLLLRSRPAPAERASNSRIRSRSPGAPAGEGGVGTAAELQTGWSVACVALLLLAGSPGRHALVHRLVQVVCACVVLASMVALGVLTCVR